jgi:hypothetical protein
MGRAAGKAKGRRGCSRQHHFPHCILPSEAPARRLTAGCWMVTGCSCQVRQGIPAAPIRSLAALIYFKPKIFPL